MLHKEVLIYQCPETGNRCPGKILDEYHARVPPAATEEDAAFYLCPLPGTPVANVWFDKQPIGKYVPAELHGEDSMRRIPNGWQDQP